MYYGIIEKSRLEQVRALWKEAFGDSESYMDFYFENIFPQNIVFGALENDRLVSAVHLNPYTVFFEGSCMNTHYIVGVATTPEYRRQGIMKKVLKMSMDYLQEAGEQFTYLMPANEVYYRSLGFESYESSWLVPVGKLQKAEEQQDLYIRTIDSINEKMLHEFNNKLKRRYDLFVPRDMKYAKRLDMQCRTESGRAYVLCRDDGVQAMFGMMKGEKTYECVEYISLNHTVEEILSIYQLLGYDIPEFVEIFGAKPLLKGKLLNISKGRGIMYKILYNGFSNDIFCDKMLVINEIV